MEPTNTEIYQSLGHIQGTVESIDKKIDANGKRIRLLEKKWNWTAGVLATIGAGVGATFDNIKNLL